MGTQIPGAEGIDSSGSSGGGEQSNASGARSEEEEAADLSQGREAKVVEWEEFHDAFVHLGGVAINLSKTRAKKVSLSEKLEAAIEIGTRSSERVDILEAMQRQLKEKRSDLHSAVASLKDVSQQLAKTKESLLPSTQGLFLSAKALAAAQSRKKEADRLLSGEGGHGRLIQLRKLLDARRRELVGQVASLYPLSAGITHANVSHRGAAPPNSVDELSLAIAGLRIVGGPRKQPGPRTEKSEFEASATALGYVAQVVSLVASYLDVPLRYPVRLGASRSYIQDYCPATEPPTVDSGSIAYFPAKQAVEFPLFSEGQDHTRSAYAIFLLNKDLEQILNRLGAESVGPRHTLSNLSRVINIVTAGVHPLA